MEGGDVETDAPGDDAGATDHALEGDTPMSVLDLLRAKLNSYRTAGTVAGELLPPLVAGERKVTWSVTITPEKKQGTRRLDEDEQTEMVTEGVKRLVRECTLDTWRQQGKIFTAVVFVEHGKEKNRAHYQIFIEQRTSCPHMPLPPELVREVKASYASDSVKQKRELDARAEGFKRGSRSTGSEAHAGAYAELVAMLKSDKILLTYGSGDEAIKCNSGFLAHVVDADWTDRGPGYVVKEVNEVRSYGAICAIETDVLIRSLEEYEATIAGTQVGTKKLSHGGRQELPRAKSARLLKNFNIRHGVGDLLPANETSFKWAISTGRYAFDWGEMSAGRETDPISYNAAFMLDAKPELAEFGDDKALVPTALHGSKGKRVIAELDAEFAPMRAALKLPSLAAVHRLTLAEARHACQIGKMPDGTLLSFDKRSSGLAVVIDRRNVSRSTTQTLRGHGFKVREFVDGFGMEGHETFVSTLGAASLLSRGQEFYSRLTQATVDALHSQAQLELLETRLGVPLFTDGQRPRPIALSDVAMRDYVEEYATIRSPSTFVGVVTTADLDERIYASMTTGDAPTHPPVQVAIVVAGDGEQTAFVVAWQCSFEYLQQRTAHT